MRKIELFPIRKDGPITPDWVDQNEQMQWIMFVVGFLVGCVATIGMVVL